MPRTLEQVLSELDSVFDPQVNSVRSQQALIPQQVAEEEKALGAKQTQAFEQILGGARQRGLGFAGIPLGEQAKYSATEYMPALARLKAGAREGALKLEDAILGIQERRRQMGQGIYEGERNFEEMRRQFNEDMNFKRQEAARAAAERAAAARAAASSGGFSMGGGMTSGGSASAPAPSAQSGFKNGSNGAGGYWFKDAGGKPISAATFAQQRGIPLGNLLYEMGRSGDAYAMRAYNVYKAEPNTVGLSKLLANYGALFR